LIITIEEKAMIPSTKQLIYRLRRPILWSITGIASVTMPQMAIAADPGATAANPIVVHKAATAENSAEALPTTRSEKMVVFRRICIDIVGRMPTVQEMDDFLNDTSPQAYGRAVDRLIAEATPDQKKTLVKAGQAGEGSSKVDMTLRLEKDASELLAAQRRALDERLRAEHAVMEAHEYAAKMRDLEAAERARAVGDKMRTWTVDRGLALTAPADAWHRAAIAVPMVKHAFLGIGVDIPGETLRSQLRLEPGAGLVVNYVDESGPSNKLIRQHDVLQKLDDQILVNGEQFIALVRMHKPNDTVKITLIREAKTTTVEVKLGEKETPVSQTGAMESFTATYTPTTIDTASNIVTADYLKLNNAAFTASGNVLAYRALRAGPIRIDDGPWTIILPPGGDRQDMTLLDSKTGQVIYRGPVISNENDPHAHLLPADARKSVIIWQKALLEQGQAKPETLNISGWISAPATQPAR
jgi:hypothetical protein